MASMGGGPLDPEPLIRMLKSQRMLNKYLTAICKAEKIPCAGATKLTMQQRIQQSTLILLSSLKRRARTLDHRPVYSTSTWYQS